MAYTQSQLDKLKAAYSSGVLQVRDGNDHIEYQNMAQMRIAIQEIEAEIANQNNAGRGKPVGTRVVTINKGYYRG